MPRWVFLGLGWIAAACCTSTANGQLVEFNHYESPQDEDDNNGWQALLALVAGVGVTSPWWAPPAVIEDDYERDGHFLDFPYQDGGGYMRLAGDSADLVWPFSLQLRGEYGYDFDQVTRIGTRAHLDTTSRLGLDCESHWFDINDPGQSSFHTGDANLTLRFAQSRHAQWFTGIGANWLHDSASTDIGLNLTYGADVFVGDPWVVSGSIDYGTISADDYFHGNLSVGALYRAGELFVGYDFLNTGAREFDTLMLGLRVWF